MPVDGARLKLTDEKVSVSLRYYESNFECFSEWQSKDLKEFSRWLGKMRSRSKADVKSDTKMCHRHFGEVRPLPDDISRDFDVYGLRVTQKARVHGVFERNTFYLLWLDRNHKLIKV